MMCQNGPEPNIMERFWQDLKPDVQTLCPTQLSLNHLKKRMGKSFVVQMHDAGRDTPEKIRSCNSNKRWFSKPVNQGAGNLGRPHFTDICKAILKTTYRLPSTLKMMHYFVVVFHIKSQ
ncbi:hypothetical protein AMECASPLE_008025 [Ameca splendens]|uniref:Uncharacterized protein n=1 Tax=Ameca splendens TaxID=208324 RepID=A0ABV0YN67_9TELE